MGVVNQSQEVRIEDPGRCLDAGRVTASTMSREFLKDALAEYVDIKGANYLLGLLPEQFDASHLADAIAADEADILTRSSDKEIIRLVKWIASCHYRVEFPHDRPISERVIYPTAADESNGMEDARLTRFVEDDGSIIYYATYTAYDGSRVKPHLIQTNDFQIFNMTRLIGTAAKNKGMALFPRRVNGKYLAVSRWDRENISIASSEDLHRWGSAVEVQFPEQPWEYIQLGNCGAPIETAEGWIVITHGVGPMREYGIGAILLDLEDPTIILKSLAKPILTANEEERDGYTPNVVYSCGALLHGKTLLLPYANSDQATRFAFVEIDELLSQLLASE